MDDDNNGLLSDWKSGERSPVKVSLVLKAGIMVSVNMPVLLGFKSNMKLDPRRIVSVCTSESSEQHDKNRLRNVYQTWTKYTVETTPNIADTFRL